MFDWNDEELENIIWGEATESDDHIVPYPKGSEERPLLTLGDQNKKERKQECIAFKPEQKTTVDKSGFHVSQLGSISDFDTNDGLSTSGYCMASWPNLSLTNVGKTNQDSMCTGVSNNMNEVMKLDSSRAETASLNKDTELFQNQPEDRDQGDFVDYGWANIGSFDDLDRIFSNDDPIFGHVSLDNADDLWSSSKVGNSPPKPFPVSAGSPSLGLGISSNASKQFEIKTEYGSQGDQCLTLGCGKTVDPTSHGLQNSQLTTDELGYAGAKNKLILKGQESFNAVEKTTASNSVSATENTTNMNKLADKVNKQKKDLKYRTKLNEKDEGKLLHDVYGTWSPSGSEFRQFEKQVAPSNLQTCPSSVLSQQRQLQKPDSVQYQHISSSHLTPSAYGNHRNHYPATPLLPHVHSSDDNCQIISGYDVSLGNANNLNKSLDASVKPLIMTPQEKIEKLRRRQQMQAMLAIQKQQQQFSHQVSCVDPSIKEDQFQCIEGADLEVGENLSTLLSLDPNSPIEQDDSNTISLAIDDYSVEDTILYQLQEIVAKLDIKVRLCIRDSLFRLAQSALQRHYASDTSSTNKSSRDEHDAVVKEEINSHNRMPDMETETNPIDRTVAHLLFYRPLEVTGKHPGTPESPISSKVPNESKTSSLVNMSKGSLPDGSKNIQNISPHGSKTSCAMAEPQHGDQYINSPCIDTSENASNNEPADGGAMEVEASQ